MSKLKEWAEMSRELKKLRDAEAVLRREICAGIIANTPMENGRVTVKGESEDMDYKAVQTLTYKVDQAAVQALWANLSDTEKEAVVFKPNLALANYKKLPESSLLHEVVTTVLAMPTLEVKFHDH